MGVSISISEVKKGSKIIINNEPNVVIQFQFNKPGKGQAFYKCKLKNMITGIITDNNFRSGEKVEQADIEEKQMEYLYQDGEDYYFMDLENYNQEILKKNQMEEDMVLLLKENIVCDVLFFDKRAIGVSFPIFLEFEITQTEPWIKGDTATNNNKPASIQSGFTLMVPSFIQIGDIIKIDTRTKEYVERTKKANA